jgi:hypothetical protein
MEEFDLLEDMNDLILDDLIKYVYINATKNMKVIKKETNIDTICNDDSFKPYIFTQLYIFLYFMYFL